MATRNVTPRANGEGEVGTTAKRWKNVRASESMQTPIIVLNSSLNIQLVCDAATGETYLTVGGVKRNVLWNPADLQP
jgi:hypothetical protein